jgi:hypothetical protein
VTTVDNVYEGVKMSKKTIKNLKAQTYVVIGALALLIIFFLIAPGFKLLYCSEDKPKLVFEEYLKDLGEVHEDASSKVVFKYRNEGNKQLIIYEIGGNCSCQKLNITKAEIAPGEVGELHADILSGGEGWPDIDTIFVKSNDSEQPVQTLEIRRFIIKHTIIQPERLIIRNLGDEHGNIRKATIRGPTADHSFKILKAQSTDERMIVDFAFLDRTPDDRSIWQLNVTMKPEVWYSVQETHEVTIFTSDAKRSAISLPIIIEENVPVKVIPKSLSFIIGSARELRKMQVSVTYFGKIDAVELKPEVNMPDYTSIALLSARNLSSSMEWIFEVEMKRDMEFNNSIQTDKIEFVFPVSDISVYVPISVIRLTDSSVQEATNTPISQIDFQKCVFQNTLKGKDKL